MSRQLFNKNDSIEKRVGWLETVVSRIARRTKKKTSAMITPYPISACLTTQSDQVVNGEVLRYLFCADGNISRGLITLNKRPDAGVEITLDISNESGGSSKSFVINKKSFLVEPSISISSGDKMIVSVEVLDPEKDKINEVWTGFLWVPNTKDTDVKSFLIDSLEKQADDILEE